MRFFFVLTPLWKWDISVIRQLVVKEFVNNYPEIVSYESTSLVEKTHHEKNNRKKNKKKPACFILILG